LLSELKEQFPKAVIWGHRDFSPDLNKNGTIEKNEYIKLCPCFDAKTEYKNL
jgi:N-acetylmuramoyl-L-alanine amidase